MLFSELSRLKIQKKHDPSPCKRQLIHISIAKGPACWLICPGPHFVELYTIRWILTSQFMFCCQFFFGGGIPLFYLSSDMFCPRTQLWASYRDRGQISLIIGFLLLLPIHSLCYWPVSPLLCNVIQIWDSCVIVKLSWYNLTWNASITVTLTNIQSIRLAICISM